MIVDISDFFIIGYQAFGLSKYATPEIKLSSQRRIFVVAYLE